MWYSIWRYTVTDSQCHRDLSSQMQLMTAALSSDSQSWASATWWIHFWGLPPSLFTPQNDYFLLLCWIVRWHQARNNICQDLLIRGILTPAKLLDGALLILTGRGNSRCNIWSLCMHLIISAALSKLLISSVISFECWCSSIIPMRWHQIGAKATSLGVNSEAWVPLVHRWWLTGLPTCTRNISLILPAGGRTWWYWIFSSIRK